MTVRAQRQRTLALLPILIAAAIAIGTAVAAGDAETVRAIVILSSVSLVSIVLFWVISRAQTPSSALLQVLWIGFGLKLAAMIYRGLGGVLADAYVYHWRGVSIARQLATGEWPADVGALGSAFMRLLTGLVYYALGVSFIGISVIWTWFGLMGMLFFYLAFATAFPEGNRRLYLLLIFLYPSMLLWTSSLGKDALMILFLGMATYGAARIQRRIDVIGLWWLALGIGGAFMVRPHLAAVFVVALGASFLNRPIHLGVLSPVMRLAGILAVVLVFVAVIASSREYIGFEELGTEETLGFIEGYQEASARGGSAFEQVDPRTPAGLAMAIPTVLFRPFPWEAHNVTALIAALEGVGLFALMVYRRRSVLAALRDARRNSFLLLCAVYLALFIFFFTAIGNFGIIARQRASQFLPFVFMLLAYLPASPRSATR